MHLRLQVVVPLTNLTRLLASILETQPMEVDTTQETVSVVVLVVSPTNFELRIKDRMASAAATGLNPRRMPTRTSRTNSLLPTDHLIHPTQPRTPLHMVAE